MRKTSAANPSALKQTSSITEDCARIIILIGVSAGFAALHSALPVPRWVHVLCAVLIALALLSLVKTVIGTALRDDTSREYRIAITLALGIFLFAATRGALIGFSRHDEIYSWNMWAIQHYQGIPYDRTYTQAPYPQLFSYWISSIYLAQGSYVSHSLARAMTAIPLLLTLLVAADLTKNDKGVSTCVLRSVIFLFLVIAISGKMQLGYADPLMVAALVTSATLALDHLIHRSVPGRSILLAAFCALIGALTKQPGILWSALGFPIIAAMGIARRGERLLPMMAIVIALLSLAWPLHFGAGFSQNNGVLTQSLGDRSYLQVFASSAYRYLLTYPTVGALIISAGYFCIRRPGLRTAWAITIIPGLIAWFVFGSYELRLGMHLIALSAIFLLLIQGAETSTGQQLPPLKASERARRTTLITTSIFGACLVALLAVAGKISSDGSRITFIEQFGQQAGEFFDAIVTRQTPLFVDSNYTYGIFYGRTVLSRPGVNGPPPSQSQLIKELIDSKASLAITSGKWGHRDYAPRFERLAAQCPLAFREVLRSPSRPDFVVYEIDQQTLAGDCIEAEQ